MSLSTFMKKSLLAATLGSLMVSGGAWAKLTERKEVQNFIDTMVRQHQFNETKLNQLFDGIELRPEVISAITSPAEAKPWYQYRKILVTPQRISAGVKFWHEHKATLERAEKTYGVPAEIIVAILGVETRYGQYKGKHPVLDSLATLAFNYPKRSKFFTSELANFLVLSKEENYDPTSLKGSYAGAMGHPQFIASSYRHYAVDFDGDGKRDLINNVDDAIGSVANYFAKHGWQKGAPIISQATSKSNKYRKLNKNDLKPSRSIASWQKQYQVQPIQKTNQKAKAAIIRLEQAKNKDELWFGYNNFYVITRYNHSPLYAMAVYQISENIKNKIGRS